MISLSNEDRAGMDAAIAASFERLQRRAGALGDGLAALADGAAAVGAHGKRLRPALVIAAVRAFANGRAEPTDRAVWQVAAAFELLHTAFLAHDDLIDRDLERRGVANVAGRFRARALGYGATPESAAVVGDAAEVLAGDLLLFEATRLIATAEVPPATTTALFELLDDAVLVSAGGELADVENAARADVPDTASLLATAHDKTAAYSFEAPLLAGAALAGAPVDARAHVAAAAADLGLAFQLVDDLIGTFGTRRQAGRAPGADLREAKRTPLVALARQGAARADIDSALADIDSALALAHTGPLAVRHAQRELEASGARDDLAVLIREAIARARLRAASPAVPDAAVSLLADIASAIERRIP